jgi:hypothetical protein
MGKSAIRRQVSRDNLVDELSGTLRTWIKRERVTDGDAVSTREKDRATRLSLSSKPQSVATESKDAIRITEQAAPLIYLLLLAASGVALVMILLSDHFYLT